MYLYGTMKGTPYIRVVSFALTIILLTITLSGKSQCRDIFGGKVECPTEEDSLVVYNNALKVYDFYENNKSYTKKKSTELVTASEKQSVYRLLEQAKKMFFVIRREMAKLNAEEKKFSAGKPKSEYKDITFKEYYSYIDEYRFYEREMENQIVNINAPAPIYDTRISPIIINEYECTDSSSVYFGDLVNIPLYIPVVVKPYMLLTSVELTLRNQILKITPIGLAPKIIVPKQVNVVKHMLKRDSIKLDTFSYKDGSPIYAFNQYGAGALIGFLVGRKFVKITPQEYDRYAVPKFARELLSDEKQLNKMLKLKFGEYYEGLLF